MGSTIGKFPAKICFIKLPHALSLPCIKWKRLPQDGVAISLSRSQWFVQRADISLSTTINGIDCQFERLQGLDGEEWTFWLNRTYDNFPEHSILRLDWEMDALAGIDTIGIEDTGVRAPLQNLRAKLENNCINLVVLQVVFFPAPYPETIAL